MQQMSRRSLITGLVSLIAAPAIVRASNLMPIKVIHEHPLLAGVDLGSDEIVALLEARYQKCVLILSKQLYAPLYGGGTVQQYTGGLAELFA